MTHIPVDMNRKKSEALVIHCADPRFQAAYRQIIDGLGQYYDLVVMPGASKALVDSGFVADNIKLLHELHHFEQIHILNHAQCGAFGDVEDENSTHKQSLLEAKKILNEALPEVAVRGYLVGENGTARPIELV